MIKDIKTVLWKEYKELFSCYGTFRRNTYGILLFTVVLGLYLPWVIGPSYVETPVVLLFYIWFPLIMMISAAVDSFAGERERHTLETLLASRLPDRAIVLGKILSMAIYGMCATVTFTVLGMAVANVAFWAGHVRTFEPGILLLLFMGALTMYVLFAVAGILVSQRMPTFRAGNDALVGGLIVAAAALYAVYYLIPAGVKDAVADLVHRAGMTTVELAVSAGMVVICLAALYVAVKLFRRNEQMLI